MNEQTGLRVITGMCMQEKSCYYHVDSDTLKLLAVEECRQKSYNFLDQRYSKEDLGEIDRYLSSTYFRVMCTT